MRMRDEKGGDDKLIAVSVSDPAFADYRHHTDLPAHILKEVRRFSKTTRHSKKSTSSSRTCWGRQTLCESCVKRSPVIAISNLVEDGEDLSLSTGSLETMPRPLTITGGATRGGPSFAGRARRGIDAKNHRPAGLSAACAPRDAG